ncbi:MAG: hypothetical protein IJT26_02685 [Bacteroidales bacterium]|nr:hypothetical protein [Bacteroidales bacterium]
MKKAVYILIAVLALSACSKEVLSIQEPASLQFDIRLETEDGQTRAVKTGWESGDVVYVFLEDNFIQYVKMVYNGSSWSYKDKSDGTTFTGLTPVNGKKLTAVYFPDYVNSSAPVFRRVGITSNYEVAFPNANGYYLSATSSYGLRTAGNVQTLVAVLTMKAPARLTQIYIEKSPNATSSNEYVLTMSHVAPFTVNSFVPGKSVTPNVGTPGFPMQGVKTTIGGKQGHYYWGILEESALGTSQDYEIQQVLRHAEKKFAISARFAKFSGMTIEAGKTAIKPTLGKFQSFVSMGFGDVLWATGNLSRFDASQPIGPDNYYIEHPLEAGDYFKYGATAVYADTEGPDQKYEGTEYDLPLSRDIAYIVSNGAWKIPGITDFFPFYSSSDLNVDAEWKTGWTTLGTVGGGILVTSRENGISLFFVAAGDYSDGILDNIGSSGQFMTSRCNNTYGYASLRMHFDSSGISSGDAARYLGGSVRPVMDK